MCISCPPRQNLRCKFFFGRRHDLRLIYNTCFLTNGGTYSCYHIFDLQSVSSTTGYLSQQFHRGRGKGPMLALAPHVCYLPMAPRYWLQAHADWAHKLSWGGVGTAPLIRMFGLNASTVAFSTSEQVGAAPEPRGGDLSCSRQAGRSLRRERKGGQN